MTYIIIKKQKNHRQKEMNEMIVITRFRGHWHFDYVFFQPSSKKACEKT